ncbi:MAG: MFS transporter, partial [Candidatus Nanopelagicales bacterium]
MKRLSATTFFYASEFWLYLAHTVTFTVAAVYFVQVVEMNPFQLVMVGTAMELAIFCFEIPTGVVADTYSRRLSLIIGWALMGAAMIVVGAVASFAVVITGYALWGFGYTFTSGAHEAWITDEVGSDKVGRVFARGQQVGYLGGLLGIGISVALASWNLGGAVAVGGALSIGFALFAIVAMPETGFTRMSAEGRRGTLSALTSTAGTGIKFVRAQPLLLLILAIAFFAGASTESFD